MKWCEYIRNIYLHSFLFLDQTPTERSSGTSEGNSGCSGCEGLPSARPLRLQHFNDTVGGVLWSQWL